MTRLIQRLLNLQREDLGRGGLLFAYLFLVIASYVVGKAARSALFLGKYAAVNLPYVTIVIAVMVGLLIVGYVRIARRTTCGTSWWAAWCSSPRMPWASGTWRTTTSRPGSTPRSTSGWALLLDRLAEPALTPVARDLDRAFTRHRPILGA